MANAPSDIKSGSPTVHLILGRLKQVRPTSNGWDAECPAHEDGKPSLGVAVGDDGKVLLNCRSKGCKPEAVVAALGLTMADLFPKNGPTAKLKGKPKLGPIVATYNYTAYDGKLLYQVTRHSPKDFRQRRPNGKGGWHWGLDGVARVPYRYKELLAADPDQWLFIAEGEKDCDNLAKLGLVATTNAQGAGKWKTLNETSVRRTLSGRKVAILPDNDDAGRAHARDVAQRLKGIAAEVRVVTLPNLPEKGDVSDWLAAGGTRLRLLELVDAAGDGADDEADGAGDGADGENACGDGEGDGPDGADGHTADADSDSEPASDESGPAQEAAKESQADKLVALAVASKMEFFHTPGAGRTAYVSYKCDGHRETWPVKSAEFGEYLSYLFYERYEKSVNPTALSTAQGHLSAYAKYKGKAYPVALRAAEHGGKVYIDLCDDGWQAVEVTDRGWVVVDECPVRFYRRPGMLALPVPEPGGSVEELRSVLNLPKVEGSDDPFILTVSWLIAALWPKGPYPVLAVNGEPGSAKSTFCKYLRGLTDPSEAPFSGAPKSEEDLMIAAHNSRVICFDNLSGIRTELSDNLCKLATGAGFRTRELFTNDNEKIICAARPCLINGIADIVHRSDLVDRSLRLMLPTIPEEARRPEAEVDAEYERLRPRVLGALLDVVSTAVRNLPVTSLDKLPRMADFALLMTAAEGALLWKGGEFVKAYERNREDMNDAALDDSPFVQHLMDLIEGQGGVWVVTYNELLRNLNLRCTDDAVKKSHDWPKNPKKLSNDLRMLAPVLRRVGYEVKHLGHKKTGSVVEIRGARKNRDESDM
jgi:hypothetical protein